MAQAAPLTGVILRRLGLMIFVIIGVSIAIFAISRLVPGDPARMIAGPRATAEDIAKIEKDLGLDRPIHIQYLRYMGDVLKGDLGISIQSRRPVADLVLERFPATLELMILAFVVAILLGVPLGVVAAAHRNGFSDGFIRSTAILGISMPPYVLALILVLLFYGWLDIAPGLGRISPALTPPPNVTGFYTIDAPLAGDLIAFRSALSHLIMPALTLSLVAIGGLMRLVRGSMIEALGEDYIRTARANGLRKARVIYGHALPNALIPLITVLGLEIAGMLFGAVIVESIFAWPGTGSLVLSSILSLDFPVITGFTIIVAAAYVTINLVVDLLYLLLDPRIRSVG